MTTSPSIQDIRQLAKQITIIGRKARQAAKDLKAKLASQLLAQQKELKTQQDLMCQFRAEDLIRHTSCKLYVCFSGGKDSVAIVLDLLDRGVDPSRIILLHHEVDGHGKNQWDWKATNDYCDAFAAAFGLTLLYSYREGGIQREIFRENEGLQDVLYQSGMGGQFHRIESKEGNGKRQKFPALSRDLNARWCSAVVKIDVCKAVIRRLEPKVSQCVIFTGERRQESDNRALYAMAELYAADSVKNDREVIHYRSVIDMKHSEVWALMQQHGVVAHPAYYCGWDRCSCQTCIYNDKHVFATIAKNDPGKILNISITENTLGFTLKPGKGILAFAEEGTAMDVDQYWWGQATEAFTHPILVSPEVWVMPAGAAKQGGSCGAI